DRKRVRGRPSRPVQPVFLQRSSGRHPYRAADRRRPGTRPSKAAEAAARSQLQSALPVPSLARFRVSVIKSLVVEFGVWDKLLGACVYIRMICIECDAIPTNGVKA